LNPPPQIYSGTVSVHSGVFGFTVTGGGGQTIIVEASTNLVDWQAVWTNALSGVSTDFTDPQWADYRARFYRARQN
jgi:hypothetical protein